MTNEALPWLGFPPAVDLANTVVVTPAGELDLLEDKGQLRAWIAAERGRIVGVEAASRRLPEVRALRETVRELLHARANGKPPPEKARWRVNAISASVPFKAVLMDEGRAVEEPDARDTYALFESTVSRSAVELADRDEDRLSVCGAPSCGMLFLRDHSRQVWCSKACGMPGAGRPACRPAAEAERARGALRRFTRGRPAAQPRATGSPIESQRRSRSSASLGRSPSRGVAPIARSGPTFDLCTPWAKPIANLTASLAGFGHDVLRERVRSGAAARARGRRR